MKKLVTMAGTALLLASAADLCFGANGSQLTAYGAKAAGMGGASVAFPQDAIAAASNPAGMAEVGSRLDGDLQFLYVKSRTQFMSEDNEHHGQRYAPVVEFGINYQVDEKLSLGFSTAASGVLFRYNDALLPNPNLDRAKGALLQVVGLPTLAYKVSDRLSLGISLALAAQRFEAQGIPIPGTDEGFPAHGAKYSFGTGWRAGALWKANDWVSFGAMYAPKIKMSKLDEYKQDLLSTVAGSIDMPEQYAFGVAVRPTDRLTLALDWQHISWQNVDAYHELFGWRSQDVFRLGGAYALTPQWTVRTGYSTTRRQYGSDFATQNALLVGINPNAVTLGATRSFQNGSELTFGYEYDLDADVKGTGPSTGTKISTNMGFVTVGFGWKF
ncbi:OmpP1/FadL family transporter [Pseudomonas fluorescens group sp. PF-69]